MATKDILIRFFNPALKIGPGDIRNVWLLDGDSPVKLNVQVHRSALVQVARFGQMDQIPQVEGRAGEKENKFSNRTCLFDFYVK